MEVVYFGLWLFFVLSRYIISYVSLQSINCEKLFQRNELTLTKWTDMKKNNWHEWPEWTWMTWKESCQNNSPIHFKRDFGFVDF